LLPVGQRVAFAVFALLTVTLGARGFYRLYLRIARGRRDPDCRTDRLAARVWYAVRTTLTQERVFRKRPVLSTFHGFIFYAFVVYLLVNLIDAVEGFVRLPVLASPLVSTVYGALADAFSILAVAGVIAFVLRRLVSGSRRDFSFNQSTLLQESIRNGYIERDSLIVSAFILFHVGSRVVGNAAKVALDGPAEGQPLSNALSHVFAGHHAMAWLIFGYWGALGSVLLFLVYFPYSKHVHLLMAPLNYFFKRDAGSGALSAVKIDLDELEPELGAARLADLSWPRLLDAYACIQCNRCQDVCPASRTGKALSPAALEINKRMALNTIASEVSPFSLLNKSGFELGTSQGPSLLEAVISAESVWACTTCGACMEVCPTQNEQMLDIVDIRRNQVMLEGKFPAPLQSAFRGMERNSNPWGLAREKRMDWAESLAVPTIEEVPDPDVLYWVGCAASYDAGAQKTARAVVQLLTEGNVNFAVLGKRETCTGDSARRAGNELLYQQLATSAIETLNEVRPKLIIASCPHCVNTIDVEYPQLGGNFTVMHHTEYLQTMVTEGKLAPSPSDATITFHDPCYLGRHRGSYEQPRAILNILSNDYVELDRSKNNSFCCGAGGAQFWKEEEAGSERISENRFAEVQKTLATASHERVLAVGCPFCKSMLQSTPSASGDSTIVIKDVAELLLEGVQRSKGVTAVAQSPVAVESTLNVGGEASDAKMDSSLAHEQSSAAKAIEASNAEEAAPPGASPVIKTERKKWVPKSSASTTAIEKTATVSPTKDNQEQ
jgi:Fe-S oxidoreductase